MAIKPIRYTVDVSEWDQAALRNMAARESERLGYNITPEMVASKLLHGALVKSNGKVEDVR